MMDNLKNILLVVNPISGDSDKELMIKKIRSKLPGTTKLEIFKTSGKKDKKKLSKLVENLKPDRILVVGGDGTVKLVAESLNGYKTTIGIVPAGSANGLASDLDLPLEIDEAITVALGKNARDLDVICINGELGLHISDFGLNAELIKSYEESSIRGKFGYALNSISTLYNSNMPYTFYVETDGKKKEHHAIMVAIANSRKFGTGAVVNPKGKMDDGKFEILIFKKFDILEILKTLQGEVEMSPDFVEIISTTSAKITTSLPIDFQIDGEYCDALKEVNAEILPKKLKIAVP